MNGRRRGRTTSSEAAIHFSASIYIRSTPPHLLQTSLTFLPISRGDIWRTMYHQQRMPYGNIICLHFWRSCPPLPSYLFVCPWSHLRLHALLSNPLLLWADEKRKWLSAPSVPRGPCADGWVWLADWLISLVPPPPRQIGYMVFGCSLFSFPLGFVSIFRGVCFLGTQKGQVVKSPCIKQGLARGLSS